MRISALCATLMAALMLSGCWAVTQADLDNRMDVDGDGVSRPTDCDDTDDTIGGPNGFYRDVDGDEYGAGQEELYCDKPEGFAIINGDCDDTDNAIYPNADELCNEVDDDCDEDVDEGVTPRWYLDDDEDDYGDPNEFLEQCDEPDGYVTNNLDCDDTDNAINPEAEEVCDDGIDQDCNGQIDDTDDAIAWWLDADTDTYGDPDEVYYTCSENPEGYVNNDLDCDDTDAAVNPDAEEVCNDFIDNDCDESPGDCALSGTYSAADADITIEGDETALYTETAVNVGDVNTDGYDDLAVGVPFAGANNNGAVLLFYGPIPAGPLTHADADVEWIGGYDDDFAGYAIAGVGDVNGDGRDDILIGAYGEDSGGEDAGMVYLIYGSGSLTGGSLTYADRKWRGAAGDYLGATLSKAGDVNNDGYDDMLLGAPRESTEGSYAGAVYLILGSSGLLEGSVEGVAVAKWTGEGIENFAGIGLSGGGDINNDGYDDIVIGAHGNSSAASDAGAAYLILGSSSPTSGSLSGADAKWTGEATGNYTGTELTIVSDINADGYDDILIGATLESSTYTEGGAAYLILGSSSPTSGSLSGADAKWIGGGESDWLGTTVASCGDINADGYDDLLFTAPYTDTTYQNAGTVYIIYGLGY